MKSNQPERDKEGTVISYLGHIFPAGRRIAAASSTATPVGHPPIARQLLDTALEKVVAPVYRAESEDMFNGVTDPIVLCRKSPPPQELDQLSPAHHPLCRLWCAITSQVM